MCMESIGSQFLHGYLKGLSHQFEFGQKWYGWKEKK
jgi:hypothetical protein